MWRECSARGYAGSLLLCSGLKAPNKCNQRAKPLFRVEDCFPERKRDADDDYARCKAVNANNRESFLVIQPLIDSKILWGCSLGIVLLAHVFIWTEVKSAAKLNNVSL